jgi:hypothetical protein
MVAILEAKNIRHMIYFVIGIIGTILWIAFEMYRAPMMDDNGKIIKPGKKLSDLFKNSPRDDFYS